MPQATFTSHDNEKATITIGTRGMFVTLDAEEGGNLYSLDLRKPEAYALANFVEWLTEADHLDEDCWSDSDAGTLLPPAEWDREEPNSYEEFPEHVNVEGDVYPDTNGGQTAVVVVDVRPMEDVEPISVVLHANTGAELEFVAALLRAAASAA